MINRVVLVGRLTRDVEVRKTQSGLSVASFTVACDRRGPRDANNQSTADFINCVAWRQSADFLGQYARKGAMVAVEGRLQSRSYDRQDGTKAYVTEVQCDNVSLCESRAASMNREQNNYSDNGGYNNNYGNNSYNNGGYNNGGYGNNYSSNGFSQPSYSQPQGGNAMGGNSDFSADPGFDISNDDLPF